MDDGLTFRFVFSDESAGGAPAPPEASPGAAQIALGHSDSRTTRQHYVAPSEIVARALDALPQPAAFAGGKAGAA